MTDFYAHGSYPAAGASGSSASMRAELDSIAAGFAKLYGYTGNGNKIVKVNGTGTGYTGSIISDDGSTVTVAGALTVTGQATVTDSLFSIKDNADATKVAKFEASGITTGTTRTYTFPDATTTFVGTDTTQELTNKTLNASVAKGTWTASGTWTLPALTLGGAVTGNSQNISGLGTLGCGAITSSGMQTINTPAGATGLRFVGRSGGANESWVFFYRNDGTTLQGGILGDNTTGLSFAGPDGNAKLQVTNSTLTTGSGITSLAFNAGNPSLNIGTGALTAGSGTFSTTSTNNSIVLQSATTGTTAGVLFQGQKTGGVEPFYIGHAQALFGGSGTGGHLAIYPATTGSEVWIHANNTFPAVGKFSSTGLSVTGSGTFTSAKPAITANGGTGSGSGILLKTELAGATRRNWAWQTEYATAGDCVLSVSNAAGGDPINAGTSILQVSSAGLSVTGTLSVSDGVNPGTLKLGSSTAGSDIYAYTQYLSGTGVKAWQVGNLSGAFTWTPSTANGGTTFSTAAMTLDSSGMLSNTNSSANYTQFTNTHATTPYGFAIQYNATPNGTSNQFIFCRDTATGTPVLRAEIRSNGGLANFSANNVNLSDERLKKDFAPAQSYYDKMKAVEVVTFLYKDQTDAELNLGVKAQQVDSVAPELIDHSGFGEAPEGGSPYLAVYQTDFQYAILKALQETMAKLEVAESRLAALEAA